MLTGTDYVYDASLATAGFLNDRPVSAVEQCSNSALVYRAFGSLLYKPSVMRQVRTCYTAVH